MKYLFIGTHLGAVGVVGFAASRGDYAFAALLLATVTLSYCLYKRNVK